MLLSDSRRTACPSKSILAASGPSLFVAPSPNMSSVELPQHMYLAAVEEYLLLTTLHGLLDPARIRDLPPALTMASRNDLVHTAMQALHGDARDHFLRYADSLASAIQGSIDVPFPPMPRQCPADPSIAERRAMNYLSEGSGSLWTAVRETVAMLQFSPDTRPFATGQTCVLGAYCKGGIIGLSKATKDHPATCTRLNAAVRMVAERHYGYNWTTLVINIDNHTSPHTDRNNGPAPSLLLGLSHHNGGELWLADRCGKHYHEVDGVFTAGQLYKTSACGVFFNGWCTPHTTSEWTAGNRVTLITFTIRHADKLLPAASNFLKEVGFCPP